MIFMLSFARSSSGIIAAFLLYKSSTNEKIDTLIAGCGDSKIITMCLIYLLAFAVVSSKAMGGVDAVVNLGINTIDVALPLGIFLIASFLSATGTSVGHCCYWTYRSFACR
jgi:Na+/H+ antiporter NhaC